MMRHTITWSIIAGGNGKGHSTLEYSKGVLIGMAVRYTPVRAAFKQHKGVVGRIGQITVQPCPTNASEYF